MSNLQLKINTELKNMKKIFNDPILFSTITFILVILIMFILFPMYNILKESFTYKGEFSLIHYKNIKCRKILL